MNRKPNKAPLVPERLNEESAKRALVIISRHLVSRHMFETIAQMALDGCSVRQINIYAGFVQPEGHTPAR